MSDNETLADILAEMRDADGDFTDHEVVDYADRIEAAAVRLVREERTEAIDEALAHAEEVRAEKCRNCERTGNATALREALEEQLRYWDTHVRTRDEEAMRQHIEAALAKPARNCDRFRTSDEVSAYWAANVHAVPLHGDAYAMRIDGREFATFLDWLFATAEGGAR